MILRNDVSYLSRRIAHVPIPVLCPVRVLSEPVPFDQSPSLHPLRGGWLSHFVRELRRYYDSVRLPTFVHHRLASLDFPTRSAQHPADKHGLSRFSRRLFPYMLRVSDRVGSKCLSRWRDIGYCLPHLLTRSAPQRKLISRFNTGPVRALVNASRLPLRTASHDSGSVWFATPLLYDSFIRNNLPV
jgi:hypothetical protein